MGPLEFGRLEEDVLDLFDRVADRTCGACASNAWCREMDADVRDCATVKMAIYAARRET